MRTNRLPRHRLEVDSREARQIGEDPVAAGGEELVQIDAVRPYGSCVSSSR